MTIEITHSYADGTLLDGTTREDTRKDTEVRAILNRFTWKWMPSIGMWGQRSSRDQLPRQGRIDATRDALEALGYTVAVHIDTTVRDQAEVDADKTARLHERADALDAKAERRTSQGQAKQRSAEEFFAHIPLGQPVLTDHYSYTSDRNRRERNREKLHQGAALQQQGRALADRADTARNSAARLDSPYRVYRRIQQLETELHKIDRELGGYQQWVRQPDGQYVFRHASPAGQHRQRLQARRDHIAGELDHRRVQHQQHRADGRADMYGPADLRKGDQVQVNGLWWIVARVNRKTVSLETGYDWTERAEYHKLTRARRDGHELAMPSAAAQDGASR